MREGLQRPGRYAFNYRYNETSLTNYIDAIKRHLAKIEDGEWLDTDSGEEHIACIAASCAIILDCQLNGTLLKDLPEGTGKLSAVIAEYQTKYKAQLPEGVVKFEDGKDCGDPDCKTAECLKTRLERLEQCNKVPERLKEKGWICTRGKHDEGPCAATLEQLQCQTCMLLQKEESSVSYRSNGNTYCNDCWRDYLSSIPG